MSKKDRPLKWCVICPNFVSVHDVYADALKHAHAISQVGDCKEKHAVAQTNLEYGSRHEKGSKR